MKSVMVVAALLTLSFGSTSLRSAECINHLSPQMIEALKSAKWELKEQNWSAAIQTLQAAQGVQIKTPFDQFAINE